MATFTWEGYMGATPDWTDLSTNTVVFSGDLSDNTVKVNVGAYQDGTHAADGDPGTDACGTNHMNNVKFLTTGTMSVNGGGSESIDDTNLLDTECTIRIHFNHSSAVVVTNGRFYTFDGTTETTPAVGVDAYAFERGVTATAWTQVNDDSGAIGGDNAGERLALGDKSSATDHYYYLAISASPESVGGKGSFDFGVAITYS